MDNIILQDGRFPAVGSACEYRLAHFDPSLENIPRQITSIIPMSQAWPKAGKEKLAEDIKAGARKYRALMTREQAEKNQKAFDVAGIDGVEMNFQQAIAAAAVVARYKYTTKNHYISDIGAGLLSMLTRGEGLYHVEQTGSLSGDIFTASGVRIICSMQTLYKAAFGPLVSKNGNAIHGAGGIVEEAKKVIMPIINGDVPTPRAYASINKEVGEGAERRKIQTVIEGEPIHIHRRMSGASDAIIIDLDNFFYPCLPRETKIGTKFSFAKGEQFIHQIAGQTAFLQLGRKLLGVEGERGRCDIDTALKIITACQAAYELSYSFPGLIQENASGRFNISIRRQAVGSLCPMAVDKKTGKIRFKVFSDAVGNAGEYFHKGMLATGISDELFKQEKLLIPATSRGAEFPEALPGTVFLKVDRTK